MKIVIFAGGTGKRFWPVSRKSAPKQFLPVGPGDNSKPLVRQAFERVLSGFAIEDIFLSTGKRYEKEIANILPEIPKENIILEPDMRDTGPAVTLAVSYINSKFPDEAIATLWADHLIKDMPTFVDCLKEGEKIVHEKNKIVFITVPARFASPHRGYIHYGDKVKDIQNEKIKCLEFKQFVEKPNVEVAKAYIEEGTYGWNPGYWIFKGSSFLNKIERSNKEIFSVCKEVVESGFADDSLKKFCELEKISADYIFAEKVYPDQAVVLLTEMGWADVGEWIALKEALEESKLSNVTKGNVYDMGSKDSLMYNLEDGKLLVTIGLNGFIVVNTPDVVAIFRKEDNTKLKELLKGFEEGEFEKYL
jgi:mannose-1-phosphate guanylyltransferase